MLLHDGGTLLTPNQSMEVARLLFEVLGRAKGWTDAQRGEVMTAVFKAGLAAADRGVTEAQFWVGYAYQTGWAVPANRQQAIARYKTVAASGDKEFAPKAQMFVKILEEAEVREQREGLSFPYPAPAPVAKPNADEAAMAANFEKWLKTPRSKPAESGAQSCQTPWYRWDGKNCVWDDRTPCSQISPMDIMGALDCKPGL